MEKNKDTYFIRKQFYIKRYLRIRLGLLQLKNKPFLNIFSISIIMSSLFIWCKRESIFNIFNIFNFPQIILPIVQTIIYIALILIPIMLLVYMLIIIGELSAQQDEYNLKIAFSESDLKNGCPILMNKVKIKNTEVTKREFYSNISMKNWEKNLDNIVDAMNVHLVESLNYGKNANGKQIVMYTSNTRKPHKRGVLYDEEL